MIAISKTTKSIAKMIEFQSPAKQNNLKSPVAIQKESNTRITAV